MQLSYFFHSIPITAAVLHPPLPTVGSFTKILPLASIQKIS